jgi:hypothetical protein
MAVAAAAVATTTGRTATAGNATTNYRVPPLSSHTHSGAAAAAATHAGATRAPVLTTGAVLTDAAPANVTRVADVASAPSVLEFTGAASGLPSAGAVGRGVAAAICVVGLAGIFF